MNWPDGSRLSVEGRKHLELVQKHVDVAIDMISGRFSECGGFLLQSHLMVEPKQLPPSDPDDDTKIGIVVVQAAGTSEDTKEMFANALKMACSEMRVFAVFTLSEAWMAVFDKSERPPVGRQVKDMPNCKEVCVVNADFVVEYDCYSVCCFAEIDRSSEKPLLKPWNKSVLKVEKAGGRLRDCVPHLTPIV